MCAPLVGAVSIDRYLGSDQLEQVICGGENYSGARPCRFDEVMSLREECVAHDVSFTFVETGSVFIKDGRVYNIPNKQIRARMAHKSGVNYAGRRIRRQLCDRMGFEIPECALYRPSYVAQCDSCGSRPICNGCSKCGKCK